VTNVGGLGEIIHNGKMGYACDPNTEAIAESLRDYYQNSRQAMFTEYLKEEKKKYEWGKMTEAFYNLEL
jgi:glycosyltransferase involved in cell wall biosynthesis